MLQTSMYPVVVIYYQEEYTFLDNVISPFWRLSRSDLHTNAGKAGGHLAPHCICTLICFYFLTISPHCCNSCLFYDHDSKGLTMVLVISFNATPFMLMLDQYPLFSFIMKCFGLHKLIILPLTKERCNEDYQPDKDQPVMEEQK